MRWKPVAFFNKMEAMKVSSFQSIQGSMKIYAKTEQIKHSSSSIPYMPRQRERTKWTVQDSAVSFYKEMKEMEIFSLEIAGQSIWIYNEIKQMKKFGIDMKEEITHKRKFGLHAIWDTVDECSNPKLIYEFTVRWNAG